MFKQILIASLVAGVAIFYNTGIIKYITELLHYQKGVNLNDNKMKLFTPEELSLCSGVDKKHLYLAILGNVFDVSKGSKHYGPGKTYNCFIGKDASRNFIDGKFNKEDISDDVIGLDINDFKSLDYWLKFYKKEYIKVGVLIGRYYDEKGKPTQYNREIKSLIKKALKSDEDKTEIKRKYPPCNMEWDVSTGSRVWCTKKSGGIERNFIGFPRKFYEPGADKHRCACISDENLDLGNIQEYENCDSKSHSCFI
ncbi:neuferricin homolog [Onthophagus taurus]|uniref:neuferricin homolog n=1 Tax=Onthophagus taurus TaxID=166361 RepID=UPI000C207712|nr:neuferricin homolog [Onthophagus taurus]